MKNLQFTEKQQLVIDILLNEEEYYLHSTAWFGAFYSTTKRTIATICELTGFSKRSVVSIIASINRKYGFGREYENCDYYEWNGLIKKDLNIDCCYEFDFNVLAKLQAEEEEVQAEEEEVQASEEEVQASEEEEVQGESLYILILLKNLGSLSIKDLESRNSYDESILIPLICNEYIKYLAQDSKFVILEKGLKAIEKSIEEGKAAKECLNLIKEEEEVQASESKTIKRLNPSTIKRYTVEQIANHADDYQLAIDTDEYRFDFQFKSIYTKGRNEYYYYMDMLDTDFNKMMITSILSSIYQLHDIKIMEESIKQMKGA